MTPEKTKKIIIALGIAVLVVGAGGIVYSAIQLNKWQKSVMESVVAPVNPQPVSTDAIVSSTENWKTYASKTDGYTIKYPSDWVYENPCEGCVSFQSPPAINEGLLIGVNVETQTLQQLVDSEKADYEKQNPDYNGPMHVSSVIIDGLPAMKIITDNTKIADFGITYFLTVHNGKSYTITPSDVSVTDLSNMLKTFKFTIPTSGVNPDTENWKMYTNQIGGWYDMQYPVDFQVKEETKKDTLFSNKSGYFRVTVKDNPQKLDAVGVKDDFYKNDDYGYQYAESFPTIMGIKSYKQGRYDEGVLERYYIPTGGSIYTIEFEFNFTLPNQILMNATKDMINKVISSFRLIR